MREELVGSLEGFSKEFASENATVKATFRSQVNAQVDQFKKEVEAELQKRRVALEEDYTEFAGKMVGAWKNVEAQLLSELQEERSRAKNAFLTETEQERSKIKTELLESQRQRATKLEEELNKFSEALTSRHGEAYRRLEERFNTLQSSLTETLESKFRAVVDRAEKYFLQMEKKIKSDAETHLSSITRQLEAKKVEMEKLQQRLDAASKRFEEQVQWAEQTFKELEDRTKAIEANARERTLSFEAELEKTHTALVEENRTRTASVLTSKMKNFEERLKKLTSELENYAEQGKTSSMTKTDEVLKAVEERVGTKVKEIEEKTSRLDHATNAVDEELKKLGERRRSLTERFEQADSTVEQNLAALRRELQTQLEQLNARRESLVKEAGRSLDEVKRVLEQETEKFSEKFRATLQEGYEKIGERLKSKMQISLENEFNKVLDEQLQVLKTSAKTGTYIKEIEVKLTAGVEKLSRDFEEKADAIRMTLDAQTSALKERVAGLQDTAFKLMEQQTATLKTQFDRINERMRSLAEKIEKETETAIVSAWEMEKANAVQRFREFLIAQQNAKLAEAKAEFEAMEAEARQRVEEAKSQMRQPRTALTRETPTQPTQPPINLAGFAFTRDGNYVTVRHPPDLPVVVLLTRRGELYCGGCLKTDCTHVQATKQWLKK